MVTEEEETRGSIADTIAQLATNYKLAQEASDKAKIQKEIKEFIESVAKGEDEVKEYTAMFDEMKE